jgi:hypothetical protein
MAIPRYLNDTSVHVTRGQSWYDLILAVHPTNPGIVLAGGIDLHKTTDSGITWTPISHWYGGFSKPEVHADQHAITFRPGSNNAALFGNDGGTYYSSNVGSSTSPTFNHSVNGYNVTQFYSVAMKDSAGSNYMLAGAQDNGSHKFTSAGVNSTTEVTGGDGAFCFIDQDNPTYQITSYVRNNWRRTINGGTSFSSITSNSTGRFINPADYDDDANILYAAAGANQIYRVSGITGTISTSTLTVGGSAFGGIQASHFRCSPYSSHVVFVGTSSGGVYKVTAANATPTSTDIDPNNNLPSGYISCIEVGTSENQLLVTYTNYGVVSVWQTLNGGTSWQNKEGNLPNMPVRWALYNPNDSNEVMLATEVGVWTTDNFGATSVDWDPSNNGLANVRCDMLQIRESDNVVAIGTHARGVFTTNVFGDNSVNAGFSASTDEICEGGTVSFTNTGTGGISSNSWTITPSTVTYVNGTSATSEDPEVKFNADGQYTVKLVSSDASGSDLDSITLTNSVTVNEARAFTSWTQNFDTITAAPASQIDSIWSLDYGTTYLWEIDSNGTLSGNTGPALDYSGTGNYLYAEASSPATSGNIAYLQTECISMPDTGYFSFWYHMYGANIGSLGVDADTGSGWFSLGQITGQQDTADTDPWSRAMLDLGSFNEAVTKLRISATRGANWDGDIAIDELSFQDRLYGCDTFVSATCAPTTGNTTYDDGVYGVKIGAVEYTSGGTSTDGAYTDRVCSDTFTVSDQGFRLYVDAGNTYSNRVRAYIDYNNDGTFDSITEKIWYSPKVIGYRNDSISIPTTGVVKGSYLRMRIMADDDANLPNDPCGTLDYGESEDFSIRIEDNTCSIAGFSLGNDTTQCGGTIALSAGLYTSYSWSTGATSSSIVASTSGEYTVEVADASGCTAIDTIDVMINSLPIVNLGNDTTQCGGTVVLSAGTFTSYLWNGGSTSNSVSAASTANYSVIVTDANGCTDTDSVDVVINSLPVVNLGNDTTQCGGTVALSAGTFTSYIWNGGSTSSSISAASTGNYSVVVTDGNGCTDTDSVAVTIHSLPTVNLGNDTTQCGGTVALSAGTFTSYLWNGGSTSSSLSAGSSGNYSVIVTDANGCTDTDSIEVVIHSLPSFSLGNDTTQCGGLVPLTPGAYSSYNWSTGSTAATIAALNTGTYSVTVTDANGCQGTDEIDVTIHALPIADLGNDTTQCGGNIALSPGSFSSYLWNFGSTASSTIVGGSGTYSVSVTDGNGCEDTDEIVVTIYSLPTADLGNDTTQCGGAVVLSPGSFAGYSWSTGSIHTSISVSTSGMYSVTVTDGKGCKATDDIQVTINDLPAINLGQDSIKCAGTVALDAGTFAGYAWNTGSTASGITVVATGTYSVTVTDGKGCSNSDAINVTIHSLPVVDLGADTVLCGASVTLDAGLLAGNTYAWNTGAITNSISATTSGTYSVIVTDGNGCDNSDNIDVTVHIPQSDFLPSDSSICVGDLLDGQSGSNYLWSTGSTIQTAEVINSGKYSVSKFDDNGCSVIDSIDVTALDYPVASFSFDKNDELSTTFNVDFINSSTNADNSSWDFGDGNTSAETSPSNSYNSGTYEATLIVSNQCGSDTVKQVIAHTAGIDEQSIEIVKIYPNPVSGLLYISSYGNVSLDAVKVYDLYGKEIFTQETSNNTTKELQMDMSSLASGTYYVAIKSGDRKIVKRIVVTK